MKYTKTFTRTIIAAAVSGTLIATVSTIPTAAYAAKTEFTFSGQISRAISYADDGANTDTLFVDNNNSGTRLRLKGKTDLENGITAGVYWESQYQDNSSSSIDIDSPDNSSAFTSRIRELWFKGNWGTVTLGQGNGAANGTSEVDYSGTSIADYSGNNMDDGITFKDRTDPNNIIKVKNGDVFSNFDGLSRNDRFRYDLPNIGPVALAASIGDERTELALRYSTKFASGGKFGFALGIVGQDDVADPTKNFDQTGVSASLLLDSGLNITIHFGEKDFDDSSTTDPEGTYFKVGQKFGENHNVSIGFQTVDDLDNTGDEAERTTLGYIYNMSDYGTELFASYQSSSLDRPGSIIDDVDQIAVGSRIKF